jgi:hypothetical protein
MEVRVNGGFPVEKGLRSPSDRSPWREASDAGDPGNCLLQLLDGTDVGRSANDQISGTFLHTGPPRMHSLESASEQSP